MHDLAGKVAIVTGASRGIGAAAALALGEAGASVVLAARTDAQAETNARQIEAAGGKAVAMTCDVSNFAACQRLVHETTRHFGPPDVLVNNAGVIEPIGMVGETDPTEWARSIEINLIGAYYAIRAVLPGMIERGHGEIIQVSSVAGFFSGRGSTYTASKNWVTSFTEGIAASLPKGVRMMALCPGFTATEFHQRAGIGKPGPKIAWLGVEQVVGEALADLRRGKVISVPSLQYKAVVAIGGLLPRAVLRRISGGFGGKGRT
jgi:NAD(P)-dependent dehydrogenase (short-subunit alcohol dehydrogenase family)